MTVNNYNNTFTEKKDKESPEATTPSSKEVIKKDDKDIATDDKAKDKFSPGEADDYNPDEFATD